MQSMNILFLSARVPFPASDGGANYVHHTIRSMKKAGHKVVLAAFTSAFHKQDIDGLRKIYPVVTVDGQFTPYTGAAILRSMISGVPVTIQHRIRPEQVRTLIRTLKAEHSTPFDTLVLEGIHMFEAYPVLREMYPDTPVVLRQSNAEFVILRRNADLNGRFLIRWIYRIQSMLMKSYEIKAMQTVDGVTFISPVDRNFFGHAVANVPFDVQPPGAVIPQRKVQERIPFRLLALSTWSWLPNQEGMKWFLKNVWPEIYRRFPACHLDIVGSNFPEHEIPHAYSDRITYHGFVDDVELYLQRSTLMVVPLFSGSGVKIKIIEAMANGLPLVTTSLGAEGINIKPDSDFLEANDAHTFIEAITRALNSPELCDQMRQNALHITQTTYDWNLLAIKLTTFLQHLQK
jgi:polysaccharide biosynthesis protein PslH